MTDAATIQAEAERKQREYEAHRAAVRDLHRQPKAEKTEQ